MSLRQAINEKCRDCSHDPLDKGNWKQQVTACCVSSCPLYAVRPVSSTPLPQSLLNHYGLKEQPNSHQNQEGIA